MNGTKKLIKEFGKEGNREFPGFLISCFPYKFISGNEKGEVTRPRRENFF